MNAKLLELAERRAMLVNRAASQREELGQVLALWQGPMAVADRGVLALRYLGRHPVLVAGVAVFAAVLRRKRIFGWLRVSWLTWRMALALKRRLT